MPGLLSSIFDGSPAGGDRDDDMPSSKMDAPGTDGASGDDEGSSSSHAVGLDNDTHLDPSITISSTMSGNYEAPDGSTHSWERTDEVTLTTDTHVITAIDTAVTFDDTMA